MAFSKEDIEVLKTKGISFEKAKEQINRYKSGFPFANLTEPATVGNGVKRLNETELIKYIAIFENNIGKRSATKFVPASGAASRMFKDIFKFAEKPKSATITTFLKQYKSLAFGKEIDKKAEELNLNINTDSTEGLQNIAKIIVQEDGLGYGYMPKGLVPFHKYDSFSRTALEEHLVEGALYARDKDGIVNIHYTVSADHREKMEGLIKEITPWYEEQFAVQYNIAFSEQLGYTDTIAVNLDNTPFRDQHEYLLFRPGGHGALIENLSRIESDIIFIKNIDNIVPDRLKKETVQYKKALAGYLILIQNKIFKYLLDLETDTSPELIQEINDFCNKKLGIHGNFRSAQEVEEVLNRPIRVCGMVKNEGEAGGGPFWCIDSKGSETLQIIESSQIDKNNPMQGDILTNATHFNPVDLICGTKDYKGNKFDLSNYIDPNTGFISYKSKDGAELKQQELPGLWNGAMAYWTTIFIEVPLITFNPVKSVVDLTRKEHI